jgi:hypothetical protein
MNRGQRAICFLKMSEKSFFRGMSIFMIAPLDVYYTDDDIDISKTL